MVRMPLFALVVALLFGWNADARDTTLDVVVTGDGSHLPGLSAERLPLAIRQAMEHAVPRDLHLVAPGSATSPNRVEWSFHTNPYAGGAVRYIGPARSAAEKLFGIHRPITAEARLFVDGRFQGTAFGETNVANAGDDPHFEALIEQLTVKLLRSAQS